MGRHGESLSGQPFSSLPWGLVAGLIGEGAELYSD